MQLLSKMIVRENTYLTFEEVYSFFQRNFPHIRYVDLEHNLMYPLRCISIDQNYYFDIVLIDHPTICAQKGKDKFHIIDDQIMLNDEHVFKLYNKTASNNELLKLLYGEAF